MTVGPLRRGRRGAAAERMIESARTLRCARMASQNEIMSDNLETPEQAVARCRNALGKCTRHASPQAWAVAQNNLGVALFELALENDGTDLVEEAIGAFRQALMVWTPEKARRHWEITQGNLAEALGELGMREKRPRISIAISKECILADEVLREPRTYLDRVAAGLRSCLRRFAVMLRLGWCRMASHLRRLRVG